MSQAQPGNIQGVTETARGFPAAGHAASVGSGSAQPGAAGGALTNLATLADRLTRTVSVARALVSAGRHIDLSGLEDGVGLLCAKTLDMDAAESRNMLAVMLELRAQIDSLTIKIDDQRTRRLRPPASPSRANAN